MHDLRARIGRGAAIENAPSCPGQRIGLGPVGKREAGAWMEAVNLLRSGGAARLSKSNIERHEAATDVRKRAIEHDLAALVAIEPEMDERAHEAAALRASHHDRLGILDEYGVVAAVIILRLGLQKGAKIARSRKTQAKHKGILGTVDQFIKTTRFETSRITNLRVAHYEVATLRAGAERPLRVRDRDTRLLFLGTHRERRNKAVSERGFVIRVDRWIRRGDERGEPPA